MEIVTGFLFLIASSVGIYHIGKWFLDSIWNCLLTLLGTPGLLGEEDMQYAIFHAMKKGF